MPIPISITKGSLTADCAVTKTKECDMPYVNPEDKARNRREYVSSGRAREKQREWSRKNKEKVNNNRRDYWKRLKQDAERYAKHVLGRKEYRRSVRAEMIVRYGGKCACCGEARLEFLGFDHINGGGSCERKSFSSISIFMTTLRRGRSDIRVLCHNCNLALGFYGKCPHEAEI